MRQVLGNPDANSNAANLVGLKDALGFQKSFARLHTVSCMTWHTIALLVILWQLEAAVLPVVMLHGSGDA